MLNPKYTRYADRLRELIEEGQRVAKLERYLRTDSSSFRISRQVIVAVLDLNNRQVIVALCDVATVILAYSFLMVIVGRKERKLFGCYPVNYNP